MGRRVDTMLVGEFWVTLRRLMATERKHGEKKTAVGIALFAENDSKMTHLAELAQNEGSGINVSR